MNSSSLCGLNREGATTRSFPQPGGLEGSTTGRVLLSHVPSSSEISVSSSSASGSCHSRSEEIISFDVTSADDKGSAMMDGLHPHQPNARTEGITGLQVRGPAEDSPSKRGESTCVPSAFHHGAGKRKLSLTTPDGSFIARGGSSVDSNCKRREPIKKRRVSPSLCAGGEPAIDASAIVSPPTLLPTGGSILLLAQPEDAQVLSPLHVFIRQQIEVFCATRRDMAQPCPGRKIAIQEHQVGLRCIHCRHLQNRVKRATCFPTSVARIYNSVNDMKFDHFRSCPLPAHVRAAFESLKKAEEDPSSSPSSSSTRHRSARKRALAPGMMPSSTAQYYHDSARKMGMVDGQQRIYLIKLSGVVGGASSSSTSSEETNETSATMWSTSSVSVASGDCLPPIKLVDPRDSLASAASAFFDSLDTKTRNAEPLTLRLLPESNPLQLLTLPPAAAALAPSLADDGRRPAMPSPGMYSGPGAILMAQPDDDQHLNPLHCFVRKRIEFFSATEQDVANPCPGRKARVQLGQVGLRCTLCSRLPFVDRVKRAVCFPPSIKGVYHSVSNMKYDHFTSCRGLASEERAEFDSLRDGVVSRKSSDSSDGTLRKCGLSSSATSRFYTHSAVRLGLVDSENGIRFQKRPNEIIVTSTPFDVSPNRCEPVGMTALMLAATDPGLREAFEKARAV